MKEYSSIFNHALAPITPGPSSSNTCGPVRIGLVCHQLLCGIPKKAVVEYYSKGAFVTTLYGMRSDLGFINGLLGKEQNDPDFSQAYENANTAGMEILFQEVDDLTVGGMETARLRLTGQNGDTMTVVGESLGSGAFRLHAIEGCPVDLRGANHELIVALSDPSGSEANKLAEELVPKVDSLNDHVVSALTFASTAS